MAGVQMETQKSFKVVRKEGGSIVLAMGKLVPGDWLMVKLTLVKEVPGKSVVVRIEKVA